MVWNTEQSSLYMAVKAHNQGICGGESIDLPHIDEECSPPKPDNAPTKQQKHNQSKGLFNLDKLLHDSDTILLAAVLLVLLNEKADKNLILAIALIIIL